MKYKLINITKFSGIVLSLLTILLWFCPIALITYAPNETTRVEKLVAPFLEVTLISSVFLILVPLIIFLIINIVDLFVNKKYLSFVEVFISIYLFVIQIIFQSLCDMLPPLIEVVASRSRILLNPVSTSYPAMSLPLIYQVLCLGY